MNLNVIFGPLSSPLGPMVFDAHYSNELSSQLGEIEIFYGRCYGIEAEIGFQNLRTRSRIKRQSEWPRIQETSNGSRAGQTFSRISV